MNAADTARQETIYSAGIISMLVRNAQSQTTAELYAQ